VSPFGAPCIAAGVWAVGAEVTYVLHPRRRASWDTRHPEREACWWPDDSDAEHLAGINAVFWPICLPVIYFTIQLTEIRKLLIEWGWIRDSRNGNSR